MTGQLLTARTVGELLDVHAETVLRWTRRGALPAIRLPSGQIRFREEDIAAWLAARATVADTGPTSKAGPGGAVTPTEALTTEG